MRNYRTALPELSNFPEIYVTKRILKNYREGRNGE